MPYLFELGKIRSQVINIPEGLPELLSDITREVLRCQPTTECLCQFIIDYLRSVINTRDKAIIAHSIIERSLRIVDDAIANFCICDLSKEKSDVMSAAMEECFRRFLEQRRCERGKAKEIIKFNQFDMLDELMLKCKFTDEELKISKPAIETAYQKFVDAYLTTKDNAGGVDCLYQHFQKREADRKERRLREESAIRIQSCFRGYLVRKSLFLNEPIDPPAATVSKLELYQNELNLAALKIQRFYRRRKSELKGTEVQKAEEISSEDGCSTVSNISLTVLPTDHHDTNEQNNENREIQYQKQSDKENESLKDQEDLQSNINEEGEDAAEEDLYNEDMVEGLQNE